VNIVNNLVVIIKNICTYIRYFTLDGYSFIRGVCNSIDILIGLCSTVGYLAINY
jgi:hypothetical protein